MPRTASATGAGVPEPTAPAGVVTGRTPGALVRAVLGSPVVAYVVVALFTAQGALLAATLRRTIYDEEYHVDVIDWFASGHGPFEQQPADLREVGDVERYGSYLYHVLMAVPWRLTAALPHDHRVLVLRLLTVLTVAGALLVLRRTLVRLGTSGLVANLGVGLVAAIPMLVFVAASVNYDGLMLLGVSLVWLAAVRVWQGEGDPWVAWARLAAWSGVACLAKYPALPLVAGTVAVLVVQRVVVRRRGAAAPRSRRGAGPARVAWLVAGAVSSLAVLERYGWNLVRFGTPVPDCRQVQSLQACMSWGPWRRNYALDAGFPDLTSDLPTLVAYVTREWIPMSASTWTYFGVFLGEEEAAATRGAYATGLLVVVASVAVVVLVLLGIRHVLALRGAGALLAGCAVYLLALGWQNYSDYLRLGQPIGVQGRYLLPVAFALVPFAVHAWAWIVRRLPVPGGPAVTALVVAAVLSQGGGLLGVLARAEPVWFRPGGLVPVAEEVRQLARVVVLDDDLLPNPRAVLGSVPRA